MRVLDQRLKEVQDMKRLFFLSRSRCSVLFFSRERDRAVETRGHIPLVYHKLYILAFGTKHYFCKTMYQSVRVNFVSSCQASL